MLGPLLAFERQGLRTKGAAPLISFFAALGLGFMVIEIGLMQRLTLFIGDPTTALVVVLAGLLLFTGTGSWIAGRLGHAEASNITIGTLCTAVLVPITLAAIHWMLPPLQTLPLFARAATVLTMVAPLGVLMGFPFASGIRYLGRETARFIPWAWGVNGLASVIASVATIIGAMRFGFDAMLLLGSALYALGFVAFQLHMRSRKTTNAALTQLGY